MAFVERAEPVEVDHDAARGLPVPRARRHLLAQPRQEVVTAVPARQRIDDARAQQPRALEQSLRARERLGSDVSHPVRTKSREGRRLAARTYGVHALERQTAGQRLRSPSSDTIPGG